jgi:hypothetical protein
MLGTPSNCDTLSHTCSTEHSQVNCVQATKRCRSCGEEKPRSAFWRNAKHPDGLASWCSNCLSQRLKQHKAREKTCSPVEDSTVYFIRSGDFVKIGWTTNLERRIWDHEGSNPHIELLCSVPGDERWELALHYRYRHLHHKREWFRFESDLCELPPPRQLIGLWGMPIVGLDRIH